VPEVLMSGHHANIVAWRREKAVEATAEKRPELVATARKAGRLTKRDDAVLARSGRPEEGAK
jgi:tRNA (guanine37-N1)-methyltransferase